MFGFLVGFLCLLGLFAVLKHERRQRGWGWAFHRGRGHHRHCGPRGSWRDHEREDAFDELPETRTPFVMRRLFERLDTSPRQEKVIRAEAVKMREAFRGLKSEAKDTKIDLASVMEAETFDETRMGDLFTRHDDRLRELRLELVGSLARVHDALDEGQRGQLAKLLQRGPGRGFFRGPYR